jgi:hypothetical protein
MTNAQQLETLFQEAVDTFPYPLETTSITQGDLETQNDSIEYGEEFTFPAGKLLDDELTAGGWIELRHEDAETTISAFFGVARNGDWDKGRILPETMAIQGHYDPETKTWELYLDHY